MLLKAIKADVLTLNQKEAVKNYSSLRTCLKK